MALSQGSSALWSDINAIYTTLRSIQSAHGRSQTAIPNSAGGKILRADIATLNSEAAALHGETHLTSASYTSVTVPAVGTLIQPGFINTIRTNVNNMNNICHFTFDKFTFSKFSFSDFSFSDCASCSFRDSGGFN